MATEKKNSADVGLFDAIREGIRNIDARSWPGLIMFLLLIAIEGGANLIASLPDFGWIVATLVALLFGVFMAGWHIITERELNSKRQQTTAEFMVKAVGVLSIVLLIVNLIRLSTGDDVNWTSAWGSWWPTALSFGGWDIFAILLIAVAFGFHLFGYLEWHNHDKGRQDRRSHAEKMANLDQKEKSATLSLRRAEVELLAIEAEENKVKDLETRFANLPPAQLRRVTNEARKEIRQAFEKKYGIDLDGDGKIGGGETESKPQTPIAPRIPPSNATPKNAVYAAHGGKQPDLTASDDGNPTRGQG